MLYDNNDLNEILNDSSSKENFDQRAYFEEDHLVPRKVLSKSNGINVVIFFFVLRSPQTF